MVMVKVHLEGVGVLVHDSMVRLVADMAFCERIALEHQRFAVNLGAIERYLCHIAGATLSCYCLLLQ